MSDGTVPWIIFFIFAAIASLTVWLRFSERGKSHASNEESPMRGNHLVDHYEVQLIDRDKNEWESGYWVVSEATAKRLVGGHIYLHRGEDEPSHIGGDIFSFHVHPRGPEAGRIVFHFHADVECSNITVGSEGWDNEMKIVW